MSRRYSLIAALLTAPAVLACVYIASRPEQKSTTWTTWAVLIVGPSIAAIVPLVAPIRLAKASLVFSISVTSVAVLLGIASIGFIFIPAVVLHALALGRADRQVSYQ